MGRPRRRSAAALTLLVGTAGLAVLAARADIPLRAATWLRPGANLGDALGSAPTECLTPSASEAEWRSVEIGRAAFRAPLLLGGVAARAGISCDTCHRSGRSNPDFQFRGVSTPPGMADVTNSLFSSHRGDGVDNPVPIPDLSSAKAGLKVDQAVAAAKLEPFIRGLIVEEFDGPEPPASALAGVAAYVRALSPAACPVAPRAPLDVAALMDDARRAATAGREAAQAGDRPTAVLMIASARTRLGLIEERFAEPAFTAEQSRLRAADQKLGAIQAALRSKAPATPLIDRWLAESSALEATLVRREDRSLFSRARLESLS